MNLYIVTYRKSLSETLVVESMAMGYCLFSKWEDRAKLFPENEADELIKHLQTVKYNEKNKFFKFKYEARNNVAPEVSKEKESNSASDIQNDPEA